MAMTLQPRILIADDLPEILEALRQLFKPEGFAIHCVKSPAEVLREVVAREFDVVLIDLNYRRDTTSGREGLELLEQLHAFDSTLPVVVMTAWASTELVVEIMRAGARDFIEKPWDNVRLITVIRNQVELGRLMRRSRQLESENRTLHQRGGPPFVARSPAMRPVVEIIERVGPSEANVLIVGENGTGKGVVAESLHTASNRATRSMVAVNVGGLSEGIFESELFGHVRGAFTDAKSERVGRFELANGGTLFLDEIANIPVTQQQKLLRVLESGEFERVGSSQTRRSDVRLISATNANLDEEVREGRFRQDLLFRLNTVTITLPPLRDRRDDIPLLAVMFLQGHATRYRKNIRSFDDLAMKALLAHGWPGNIRELNHVIERAVLMAADSVVRTSDLGLRTDENGRPEETTLEQLEIALITKALTRFDGNVSRAAEVLGLSRSALYRRIQRFGL